MHIFYVQGIHIIAVLPWPSFGSNVTGNSKASHVNRLYFCSDGDLVGAYKTFLYKNSWTHKKFQYPLYFAGDTLWCYIFVQKCVIFVFVH